MDVAVSLRAVEENSVDAAEAGALFEVFAHFYIMNMGEIKIN